MIHTHTNTKVFWPKQIKASDPKEPKRESVGSLGAI